MPDEYLPPNKILFLQNLPESVNKEQLLALFSQYVGTYISLLTLLTSIIAHRRYPNLHEVRLIPTKKDIAFVEYVDEGSASVAKDALHNYKLDGENKIKVRILSRSLSISLTHKSLRSHSRENDRVSCVSKGGILVQYIVHLYFVNIMFSIVFVYQINLTR